MIALVSFAFNIGLETLEKSNLLKRLNQKEDPNKVVEEEMPKWRYATKNSVKTYEEKVECRGLIERRQLEIKMFKDPVVIIEVPEAEEFNGELK